jgi:acetolactate synthase-1/2/3 large subunit
MTASAAEVFVDLLVQAGVDRLFCLPGESFLPVLDQLRDRQDLRAITCRHEESASFMAVADAKLGAKIGVALVSRGPGASNAMIAVHTARQDAVPMVLVIGQVPRGLLGRGAFQEIDYTAMFASVAKSVEEVSDPDRMAGAVLDALRIAQSGTPGPVVLSVPSDVWPEDCLGERVAPPAGGPDQPDEGDVAAVSAAIEKAERPLVVAGGALRTAAGRKALARFAEAWRLPVMVTFENQDAVAGEKDYFGGVLGIRPPASVVEMARAADLVLAVGTRLPDMATQHYTVPHVDQALVHVYPAPSVLDVTFRPALSIVSDPALVLESLAARCPAENSAQRQAWCARVHDAFLRSAALSPRAAPDGVDFGHMVAALQEQLPANAIVTSDAGSFASWLHRHLVIRSGQLYLGAISGAMGFGVPAAVAAALRYPDRPVVAVAGDGGMLMTGCELATAAQYGAKLVVIVADNKSLGTIRFHQERTFPGRPHGTNLRNPDFAHFAQAFGALGLTVARPEECGPALQSALAHDGVSVISVQTSLECITANTTLADLVAAV